ncbi:hypothetical protein NK428_003863 [Vibrio navarrensis]|nr:hypothetical protein [Vibrio navarrensis]
MKISYELINIIMLLIPGFLSVKIFDLFRNTDGKDNIDRLIEGLIYNLLIYAFIEYTYGWTPAFEYKKVNDTYTYAMSTDKWLISITIILCVIFPLIWGAITHYDWHMKLLRKLRLTNKTSRQTAWDDVFSNEVRFLSLHLKDGRTVVGWPTYFSNDPDEGFIYLTQAAWVDDEGKYIETNSHGILFHKEHIEFIEFMQHPEEEQGNDGQETTEPPEATE